MPQSNHPYRAHATDVLQELGVDPARGLSLAEVRERLAELGPNKLTETRPRSTIDIFVSQFRSSVVALLAAAAALSFAFGDLPEGIAIVAVIFINAAIGFATEVSATRSMEALYRLGTVNTRVRRAGEIHEVPATDLVPGDIVVLEGGDIITADLRIIEASKLQCDESALTGESAPVSKRVDALEGERPLAERANMAYKGTSATRGAGEAVVVATGMKTELGEISSLVEEAEEQITPLEQRLGDLGRRLVWVILVVAGVVSILGIVRGREALIMVETGIALAVASIPEGLPIVATIALSRGLLRMARRKALVRQLSSVETLGSTTLICSDKTGTLTENRMTVTRLELVDDTLDRDDAGNWTRDGQPATPATGDAYHEALKICALCNNATVEPLAEGRYETTGDPLETALLIACHEAGLDPAALTSDYPELREESFESETKMMATYHETPSGVFVAVKGAPEVVIAACTSTWSPDANQPLSDDARNQWLARNDALASDGFRLLALACKTVDAPDAPPYENLALIGLVAMLDPPREEIRESLDQCRDAGVRVIMVTGDQAPTALYVARSLGIAKPEDARVIKSEELRSAWKLSEEEEADILAANVFARVDPKQKLDLITLHQKHGEVVAMTGDGVNDAPALKKADIGVAMGQRGTQVAREVADVVLRDDSFRTIVYAIQEGRVIFGNIRKFVLYLLSCNIAEIMVVFLASLANTPLPILPLQILFLNLVTDVFPALALGVGEGGEDVMQRPPKPAEEPILTRRMWRLIVWHGLSIALATLAVFFYVYEFRDYDPERAVTVSFMTLAMAQLWHVFNMRDRGAGFISNEVTRNRVVWGALVLCLALLAAAVYLPGLSAVLSTVPLAPPDLALILAASLVPVALDAAGRKLTHD